MSSPSRNLSPSGFSSSSSREKKPQNLFIGDLDYQVKPHEINEIFSRYGTVSGLGLYGFLGFELSVEIKKGYAFITLCGDVDDAIKNISGKVIGSGKRNVVVEVSRGSANVKKFFIFSVC
jgi:RNA recognition motif-containing protein